MINRKSVLIITKYMYFNIQYIAMFLFNYLNIYIQDIYIYHLEDKHRIEQLINITLPILTIC